MAMDYINYFHTKALQNLPKFGFLGLKTYQLATAASISNVFDEKFRSGERSHISQQFESMLGNGLFKPAQPKPK
jgi:hypothetical protein